MRIGFTLYAKMQRSAMAEQVSVIIVNWNGRKYLDRCLSSLLPQTYAPFNIILVDNGSTDDSLEFIRNNFPMVEIVALERNYGFAKANNRGITQAFSQGVQFIALLNNDTEVDRNWLAELVKGMYDRDDVGIGASKILNMDNRRIIDSTGHIFSRGIIRDRGYGMPDNGQYDKKLSVLGACAAACLYRRRMLEEIGLFDEDFGSYYEDAELSLRARSYGWKARYVPEAIVYHMRQASSKNDVFLKEQLRKQSVVNLVKLIQRYASLPQFLAVSFFWFKEALQKEMKSLFLGSRKGNNDYWQRLQLLWSKRFKQ